MIRKINIKDKDEFLVMAKDFYNSDAVLHPIPQKNIENTFKEIMSNSPYADAYIAQRDGNVTGYALLAKTYSNEAGGIVIWVEELYVCPEYRKAGIGSELLNHIINKYKNKAARIRLEVEDSNTGAMRLYRRFGFKNLEYGQIYI